MDNFLAEIRLFPFGVIPRGWAACNGQTMQIQQNAALYSLLGTYYGGNGSTTFMLPNLNGRAIMGTGLSAGSTNNYVIGNAVGSETVTLTTANMALHTHIVSAGNTYELFPPLNNFIGNPNTPTSSGQTKKNAANANFYNNGSAGTMVQFPAAAVTPAGSSAAHENRMPYLAMNYCIAIQGIYPTRQ